MPDVAEPRPPAAARTSLRGTPLAAIPRRLDWLVRVMPGPPIGSPLPAPFLRLKMVHAGQQHQDRKDPDDKKHKHQSNRFLTAHTAILYPAP